MTVYGPYDQASWITMLMLKEDNHNMISLKNEKFSLAIKKNTACLKEFFKQKDAA